jgi:diguanylate cyclase (GGDEF)-like protein
LVELEAADSRYGEALESRGRWHIARREWQELKTSGLQAAAVDSFARHTAVIDELLGLMREVSESSGLRFDPQADSYFMIDAALIRLPRLLEHLGQLRGRGSPMFSAAALTDNDRLFVSAKVTLIREELTALGSSVASAAKHNLAVKQQFDEAGHDFLNAVQPFVSAAEARILIARREQTSDQFFALGTKAIDAGTRYVDIAEATLRALLLARAESLQKNKVISLGLSAILVGLIFVIATFLVRSVIAQETLRRSQSELERQVEERTSELRKNQVALREINEKLNIWVGELEQRYREMARLGEMVRLLQTCATAQEFHDIVSHQLPKLFGGDNGALYEIEPGRNVVVTAAAWGPSPPARGDFAPDDCWALRLGRPHIVAGTGRDGPLCQHLQELDSTYACFPLIAQGDMLGVLHLRCTKEQLTEEHRPFPLTVAENLALGLANVRLREALRQQAVRDPLTGLYNRRFMEEALERELRRAARENRPLALLMGDIDYFKDLNDSFGHDIGDAVLREVAGLIGGRIRGSDSACRYGGEEFLIILPDTPLHEATGFAETLRAGVRAIVVQEHDHSIGPVTCSFGVAASSVHGTTAATLLRAADAALYHAKAQGRDRVVVASAVRVALPE